jgi:hypothetical protein
MDIPKNVCVSTVFGMPTREAVQDAGGCVVSLVEDMVLEPLSVHLALWAEHMFPV